MSESQTLSTFMVIWLFRHIFSKSLSSVILLSHPFSFSCENCWEFCSLQCRDATIDYFLLSINLQIILTINCLVYKIKQIPHRYIKLLLTLSRLPSINLSSQQLCICPSFKNIVPNRWRGNLSNGLDFAIVMLRDDI